MVLGVSKARFKIQAVVDFAGRYIYRDNHEKTGYNRICSSSMDKTMRSFWTKMATICVSLVICLIGPTYAYFAHGIRTTWTSDRIPFTAPNSDAEFIVNVLLQTIVFGHGFVGYFGLEVVMTVMENVVTVTPRLLTNELVHTIRQYKDKMISESELRCKMNNFVKSTCDLNK